MAGYTKGLGALSFEVVATNFAAQRVCAACGFRVLCTVPRHSLSKASSFKGVRQGFQASCARLRGHPAHVPRLGPG